jgi:hypothetical protein
VTGLHPEHRDVTSLAAMIANRTVPPLSVRASALNHEGKPVVRIEVARSERLIASSDGTLQRRRSLADGTPECVPFPRRGAGGRNLISADPLPPGTVYTASVVAAYSILRKASPQPGLLILGDMSIQGNIKPVRSLVEPLQVAMDNGAKRALVPIENKRQFLEVNADVLEHVDPIFYGDLRQAAFKALGLS